MRPLRVFWRSRLSAKAPRGSSRQRWSAASAALAAAFVACSGAPSAPTQPTGLPGSQAGSLASIASADSRVLVTLPAGDPVIPRLNPSDLPVPTVTVKPIGEYVPSQRQWRFTLEIFPNYIYIYRGWTVTFYLKTIVNSCTLLFDNIPDAGAWIMGLNLKYSYRFNSSGYWNYTVKCPYNGNQSVAQARGTVGVSQ